VLQDKEARVISERRASLSSKPLHPCHHPASWAVTHFSWNRAQLLKQLCPEGHQIHPWQLESLQPASFGLEVPFNAKRGMRGSHFQALELDHGFQRLTQKNIHITQKDFLVIQQAHCSHSFCVKRREREREREKRGRKERRKEGRKEGSLHFPQSWKYPYYFPSLIS
jgi:hypothetical protein